MTQAQNPAERQSKSDVYMPSPEASLRVVEGVESDVQLRRALADPAVRSAAAEVRAIGDRPGDKDVAPTRTKPARVQLRMIPVRVVMLAALGGLIVAGVVIAWMQYGTEHQKRSPTVGTNATAMPSVTATPTAMPSATAMPSTTALPTATPSAQQLRPTQAIPPPVPSVKPKTKSPGPKRNPPKGGARPEDDDPEVFQ
jgi:hypothetical protein